MTMLQVKLATFLKNVLVNSKSIHPPSPPPPPGKPLGISFVFQKICNLQCQMAGAIKYPTVHAKSLIQPISLPPSPTDIITFLTSTYNFVETFPCSSVVLRYEPRCGVVSVSLPFSSYKIAYFLCAQLVKSSTMFSISRPQSSSLLRMNNFVPRVFLLSNVGEREDPGDEVGSGDETAHLQNSSSALPRFHGYHQIPWTSAPSDTS